jgi:hypothetical protein
MKISEAKLRKIVRTMVEQMDRTSYRPSWEDEELVQRAPVGAELVDAIDLETFINNINDGFGWIEQDDIARQWDGMFNQSLTGEQTDMVANVLNARGMLDDDELEDETQW